VNLTLVFENGTVLTRGRREAGRGWWQVGVGGPSAGRNSGGLCMVPAREKPRKTLEKRKE
jgi:hypothetical protein